MGPLTSTRPVSSCKSSHPDPRHRSDLHAATLRGTRVELWAWGAPSSGCTRSPAMELMQGWMGMACCALPCPFSSWDCVAREGGVLECGDEGRRREEARSCLRSTRDRCRAGLRCAVRCSARPGLTFTSHSHVMVILCCFTTSSFTLH